MNTHARMALVLGAVGWCLLSPAEGRAQTNTVSISSLTVPSSTSIKGNGDYTLATGYSAMSIALVAVPAVGGGAEIPAGALYSGGTWQPTTITGLTANTKYEVRARMIVAMGATQMTIWSPTSTITTPP